MDNLLAVADKHLAKNYGWLRRFMPRGAAGCWMWEEESERYLDMVACYSAINFGYGRPEFNQAVQEALNSGLAVAMGSILTPDKVLLSQELAEFCGMDDAKIVPMNSGAEAVETALKLARKWGYENKKVFTNQAEIIFCDNNFHGRTIGIVSASTVHQYRDGFGPFVSGVRIVPFGDAAALEKAINESTVAFVLEPIQGEGGIVIPPKGYLKAVRKICSKYNILMVCDEIQTGFGRTGKVLACDHENVRPDLMTLGKALGGGVVPISAVVGRKDVMEVFQPGDHGSTFGGNALACHVARAVLRFMQETHPEKDSEKMGVYLMAGLRKLAKKHRAIKEVRGRGLMVGVEFYEAGPSAHDVCEALFKERIIAKETRDYVLRFSPPLMITDQEIDFALQGLDSALTKLEKEGK